MAKSKTKAGRKGGKPCPPGKVKQLLKGKALKMWEDKKGPKGPKFTCVDPKNKPRPTPPPGISEKGERPHRPSGK